MALPTIVGSSGVDKIKGTAGVDVIAAGSGNDVVKGEGGDDIISGGNNRDRIQGGEGADVIDGGGSNDVVTGGEGDDVLFGSVGDDRLIGGNGSDTLIGGDDNDVMNLSSPSNSSLGDGSADIVYFDDSDGVDSVTGFESGLDSIVLTSGTAYTLTDNGTNSFLTYGTTTVTFVNEIITATDISFGAALHFSDFG